MSGSQKDDADHLAAYAEHLVEKAKFALVSAAIAKGEARMLLLRANIAIKEAQAIIKPCRQQPKRPAIVEWAISAE